MTPYAGEFVEIRLAVFFHAIGTPKRDRHAEEGLRDHEVAFRSGRFDVLAVFVPDLDFHAQRGAADLTGVDWVHGSSAYDWGVLVLRRVGRGLGKLTSTDQIGPAGSVDEAYVLWEMGVEPVEEFAAQWGAGGVYVSQTGGEEAFGYAVLAEGGEVFGARPPARNSGGSSVCYAVFGTEDGLVFLDDIQL